MKRILKKNINDKPYWDRLLSTGQWGDGRGKLYILLAKYFPKNKKITALDIGCAVGHGTIALAKKLPYVKFEACDFSTKGIKAAKNKYGKQIKFFVHDVYKDELNKKYDYILFIETLEHIENPVKVLRKYIKYSNERVIVTVPYKEKGWKEHLYFFDEKSFDKIKEFRGYKLLRKPGTDRKIILYIFDKS